MNRKSNRNLSTMMQQLALLAWVVFLLMSCSNPPFFNEFYTIPGEEWNMKFKPGFKVRVTQKNLDYRLILQVRNTTDYAYSNVFFFLTTTQPSGKSQRDTIECVLADRYGNWLGKGIGRIKENNFLIREYLSLPDTGTYNFIIEQAMRDEVLKGITDIGIKIEQH